MINQHTFPLVFLCPNPTFTLYRFERADAPYVGLLANTSTPHPPFVTVLHNCRVLEARTNQQTQPTHARNIIISRLYLRRCVPVRAGIAAGGEDGPPGGGVDGLLDDLPTAEHGAADAGDKAGVVAHI